jgi:glycosyl transferase family 25
MAITPQLDRIYLINVRSYTERLAHARAQLARYGLEADVVHEWDIGDITPEIDARYFNPSTLSPGQKSCGLKHVTALWHIVNRRERYALVLEDDIVLADGFNEGLEAALTEAELHPQPHVTFIGCGGNFYTPRSQRRKGQRIYRATRGRFADSYIIGIEAARQRLEWITQNRISLPIDNQFEVIDRQVGITMLWLEDPVVEQGSKLGLFTTTLESAKPNWLQHLSFMLEKLRRKYVYQLWR